jgi:hypothetical protein
MRAISVCLCLTLAGCAVPRTEPDHGMVREVSASRQAEFARQQQPIQWSSTPNLALSQAVAIVSSYETYSMDCEIGLKVYGKGRLPPDKQESCRQALSIGIGGGEFQQSAAKISELGAAAPSQVDQVKLERGLRSAVKVNDRWLFIRHQLIGR